MPQKGIKHSINLLNESDSGRNKLSEDSKLMPVSWFEIKHSSHFQTPFLAISSPMPAAQVLMRNKRSIAKNDLSCSFLGVLSSCSTTYPTLTYLKEFAQNSVALLAFVLAYSHDMMMKLVLGLLMLQLGS